MHRNRSEIQSAIVSTFWSQGLKRAIAAQGWQFTPEELTRLAVRHILTLDERVDMLRQIADAIPETAAMANRAVEEQLRRAEAFRSLQDGEVYLVEVHPGREYASLWCVCAGWAGVESAVADYAHTFGASDAPGAEIRVEKRRVVQPGEGFDSLGDRMCMAMDGRIREVTCLKDECRSDCDACAEACCHRVEVRFPRFLPDHGPVMCRNRYTGEVDAGCLVWGDECGEEAAILSPDGGVLRHLDFSDPCWGHYHADITDVDLPAAGQISEDLMARCNAVSAYLDKQKA